MQGFFEGGDERAGGGIVDARAAPASPAHMKSHGPVVELHADAVAADDAVDRLAGLIGLDLQIVLGDVMAAQDHQRAVAQFGLEALGGLLHAASLIN